ncbi:KAP family P-loop NTPase fold protein [Pseudoalteromonas luteoviolacea]|uniref:KAP NTPase domain-containing protein n=1 Tax=Pseudoalteromonas luteoviolacea H33 TaxID=1365251 RepID=A0A167CUR2_9GAMM|nr:P-loop NTPase fold protein [Pseudoalteromonas luteoviolacea]KZN48091.1 hypothetical protein N476_22400 [Pseudoalteromonas luteoviolacea H33]KZN72259.1 hypothetical protein N477_25355 [Pseudoalteromonas luteoviolacea H33-S]
MSIAIQDIPLKEHTNVINDALGLSPYAKSLGKFIQHCATPMTIAIQGDWGTGKTSLMRMIEHDLIESDVPVDQVWFNTWVFSQFNCSDDLPILFLETFISSLSDHDEGEQNAPSKAAMFLSTIKPLAFGAAKVAANYATAGISSQILAESENHANNQQDNHAQESGISSTSAIANLKEQIAIEVKNKIETHQLDRIIVYIDDLDRIPPKNAIELLETIKLFTDIEHLVFVLALDFEVVKRGVELKYGTTNISSSQSGKSFFDKLIQLPFQMPVIEYKTHTRAFLTELLGSINMQPLSEKNMQHLENLVLNSVGLNPRSIKRLINIISLYVILYSETATEDNETETPEDTYMVIFAMSCLQSAFYPVYQFLLANLNNYVFYHLASHNYYFPEEDEELSFIDEKFLSIIRDPSNELIGRERDMIRFFTTFNDILDTDESGYTNEEEFNKITATFKRLSLYDPPDIELYSNSYNTHQNYCIDAIQEAFERLCDRLRFKDFDLIFEVDEIPEDHDEHCEYFYQALSVDARVKGLDVKFTGYMSFYHPNDEDCLDNQVEGHDIDSAKEIDNSQEVQTLIDEVIKNNSSPEEEQIKSKNLDFETYDLEIQIHLETFEFITKDWEGITQELNTKYGKDTPYGFEFEFEYKQDTGNQGMFYIYKKIDNYRISDQGKEKELVDTLFKTVAILLSSASKK